ncbi:MAG TPA: CGNR zinc finger domain-containing protein, partial [Ktedonobacterales bacterium]
ERPAEAADTFQMAITFREALYRILLAAVTGKLPPDDDLAIFNAARAQALAHSAITAAAGSFAWQWNIDEDYLGWMLWPIIYAAAELLLSSELKKVKQCSGPDCGWLFLDTSKNHTRRWCSMEGCGNRAKARSHYQRKRQSAQAQAREVQPSP